MMSRSLAVALLAAGFLTAAAGGSYLAVRQNASAPVPATADPAAEPAPAVHESEAVVTPQPKPRDTSPPLPESEVEAVRPERTAPPPPRRRAAPVSQPVRRPAAVRASHEAAAPAPAPVPPLESSEAPVTAPPDRIPAAEGSSATPAPADAAREAEPLFEEIVVPAASVVGLELETTVTSERAQIEDRVDARVTRDVYADGRLAIPAGSRVVGAVTLVERGGKVKERARLGIRFHTLVLANGRQVSLRTETIHREGASPSNESSRKIGGAAIGGAVLGAILGGGKGAIAGATAGAAGGTAVVMAGDRNPATLNAGSVVTVKLTAPASFEVER